MDRTKAILQLISIPFLIALGVYIWFAEEQGAVAYITEQSHSQVVEHHSALIGECWAAKNRRTMYFTTTDGRHGRVCYSGGFPKTISYE